MACGTPAIGLAVGGAPDALGDGELGACVTEAEFPAAFRNALAVAGKTDRAALSGSVKARFGKDCFTRAVSALPIWR